MSNISTGDRVVTTADLGTGAGRGTKGTVTHVSTWHGLASVRFDSGNEVASVKLSDLALA